MPKYSTLQELKAAFDSGELDDSYYVMLDKGGSSISLRQDGPEETSDERWDRCHELFKWEYDNPIPTLLKMVGIRSEWC